MPYDFGSPYIPDVNNILAAGAKGYAMGNQMRQQNAMSLAGQSLAQGDQTSAKNALYNAGEVESGLKMEDHFRQAARQADADKLAKAQRFNDVIGNLVLSVKQLPPEAQPEAWKAAIGHAKSAGLDVSKYEDPSTMDFILAQSDKTKELLGLELQRRRTEMATQKATAPKKRSFSVNEATKLAEKGATLESIKRFGDSFNEDFAGYGRGGEGMMTIARNLSILTGPTTESAATWWQDYNRYKNVVRNELFGSALTESEKAAFDEADINPNMDPKAIRRNLDIQKRATQSALRKAANALAASGYSQEAIEGAIGAPMDELNSATLKPGGGDRLPQDPNLPESRSRTASEPPQVQSAQEAQELIKAGKLKSGDVFIDENGQPRTVK